MSRAERRMLRARAKKQHKKMMKGLPRSQRVPFSTMYQQARKAGAEMAPGATLGSNEENVAEDFDMSGLEGILVDAEESDEITDSE